jgi:hypothetical protein
MGKGDDTQICSPEWPLSGKGAYVYYLSNELLKNSYASK